eukprot:ctg_213.g101
MVRASREFAEDYLEYSNVMAYAGRLLTEYAHWMQSFSWFTADPRRADRSGNEVQLFQKLLDVTSFRGPRIRQVVVRGGELNRVPSGRIQAASLHVLAKPVRSILCTRRARSGLNCDGSRIGIARATPDSSGPLSRRTHSLLFSPLHGVDLLPRTHLSTLILPPYFSLRHIHPSCAVLSLEQHACPAGRQRAGAAERGQPGALTRPVARSEGEASDGRACCLGDLHECAGDGRDQSSRVRHGRRAVRLGGAQPAGRGGPVRRSARFFLKGVADRYQVQGFDVEAAKAAFFRIYLSKYTPQLEPFPGVKRLIDTLKTRDVRVALASSADAVKVDGNLNAIGIPRDTFDYVTHSDSIPRKKPAPDIFLAAAAGLGLEPRACVVIEDSEAGVVAAKAAGMRCVAVATSLSRNRLWKAGADTVLDSPEEITESDLIVTPEVAQLFQK